MRILYAVLLLITISSEVRAGPIDLNDFFADPTVTVAADGSSAFFVEDPGFFSVILSNDPGFGDPNVIIPADGTTLSFDFDFLEAAGNDDEFFASLIDGATGLAISGFDFFTSDTSSGTVEFDLSSLVGQILGMQFSLDSFDNLFDSTLTISNVSLNQLVTEPPSTVPEPGGLALFGIGFALLSFTRRKRLKVVAP